MKTFRTKVFHQAYELAKGTNKSFSICLTKAWALYRLTKQMRSEIVTFCYEKTDGTLRKAKGTLKNVQNLIKGTGVESYSVVKYFDVDVNAFRSFKVENLVVIY